MHNLFKHIVSLIILFSFSSCASVFNGVKQDIHISSYPSGATVKSEDFSIGDTPLTISLKRDYEYILTADLEGYEKRDVIIYQKLSKWAFGNILFGPFVIIGVAIDFLSGSLYYLSPEGIDLELRKIE